MKSNINKIIVTLIFFLGCANPLPPSGGPPDKTPPEIVGYAPEQGTVNFKGEAISIEFSEWVNKSKVIGNVFISPEIKLEYDWSGKELEIEFGEKLDTNVTYALTLGTDYTDLHQNNPKEAFTLTFSASSRLDSGKIEGKLFAKDASGVFIFAYKIDEINPDTLNPAHTAPKYKTQVGSNGKFKILALREGVYRVMAVRDKYSDGLCGIGADDFGAASGDVSLKTDSVPFVNIKLGPPIDETGPGLYYAESIFSDLISLNFSEPISLQSYNQTSFALTDSLTLDTTAVLATFPKRNSETDILIIPEAALDTGKTWKIEVIADSSLAKKIPADTVGNAIQDTANVAYFTAEATADTLEPNILKTSIKDSSESVELNHKFEFAFNRPVSTENLEDYIEFFQDDSASIGYFSTWQTPIDLILRPRENLETMKWYSLSLDLRPLETPRGTSFKDTVLSYDFKTKDVRNHGEAEGKIDSLTEADSLVKIIFESESGRERFVTTPDDSGKWSLSNLPAGSYKVELYYDADGDGEYDYGYPFPFERAEPFIVLENPVKIKSRWTMKFNLPNPKRDD